LIEVDDPLAGLLVLQGLACLQELLLQGALLGNGRIQLMLLLIHAQLKGERHDFVEELPLLDVGVGLPPSRS